MCRALDNVVTADMQAAADQVRQLQKQLMHHQAELGAKRADVQVGRCYAMLCYAVPCCAALRSAVLCLKAAMHEHKLDVW